MNVKVQKGGADIAQCISNNLAEPVFNEPEDLPDGAGKKQKQYMRHAASQYFEDKKNFAVNRKVLYALVWGQCSESVRARLGQTDGDWIAFQVEKDGMALLRKLRNVMQHHQDKRYGLLSRADAKALYRSYSQPAWQSPNKYHKGFVELCDALKAIGAHPKPDDETIEYFTAMGYNMATANDMAIEAKKSVVFLRGAHSRYYKVMDVLANQYLRERNGYPWTVDEALSLLVDWADSEPNRGGGGRDGITFTSVNGTGATEEGVANATKGGREKKDITCFACRDAGASDDVKKGHYSYEEACPLHADHKPGHDYNDDGGKPAAKGPTKQGVSNTTVGYALASDATGFVIEKDWLLLDNQANIDVFVNGDLLNNIRKADTSLTIHSTSGTSVTDLEGDFDGNGTVWYHPDGIANILSLSRVSKMPGMKVDYSQQEQKFTLTKPDGNMREFVLTKGLYVSKMTKGVVMVSTVADNKRKYTVADYTRATVARKLQIIMGRPSTKELLRLVDGKLLANCPVTRLDIMAAEDIFGPDVGSLYGKTVRRAPQATRMAQAAALPVEIMARYRTVTLTADIMFVNKMPFLITFSRNIRFGMVEKLGSRSDAMIMAGLHDVFKLYRGGGFSVDAMLMDGEFESLRGMFSAYRATLNTTAHDEQVGDVERYIRTVKEQARATYNTMPFERMPHRLVIEMVCTSVFWLNSFSSPNGISDTLSPREIVLRQSLDYNKHCQLEFGTYVQTHEQHDNGMGKRTTGAIALRPTGNAQGGHYFMSLTTGRRLARNNWTVLPMPQDVFERVRDMATREQQSLAARQRTAPGLAFLDRNQLAFDDDIAGVDAIDDQIAGVDGDEADYDYGHEEQGYDMDVNPYNYYEPDAAEAPHELDAAEAPHELDAAEAPLDAAEGPLDAAGAPLDAAEALDATGAPLDAAEALDAAGAPLDAAEAPHDEFDANEIDAVEAPPHDDADAPFEPMLGAAEAPADAVEAAIAADMDARWGPRTEADGLRARRNRDYTHRYGNANVVVETVTEDSTDDGDATDVTTDHGEVHNRGHTEGTTHATSAHTQLEGNHHGEIDADAANDATEAVVIGFIFAQVSMKKGLKLYGDRGEDAVQQELQQLHDRRVMMPVEADSLSYADKKKALEYLMFLKEKKTGKIKGRGCADGRKQRVYTAKEEASSPTVSIESIMLTSVIDALEGRHVATADIPGAFMQADMDEVVHMRLVGTMVDLLLRIAPEYAKYVVMERGQKVLYMLLLKALYGTMRAALLFWRKLTSKLQEWGFVLNPYDPCVANKMIDGSQCTVLWHVDDLKISHVNRKAVETVLGLLSDEFGNEGPLIVCHEKAHDYLGMRIDYSEPGKVKFTMFDYIDSMLESLPADMSGVNASPAPKHLFEVSPHAIPLDKKKAELFHHYTAKLLFLCKRARPDIQTAVAFLMTRVKGPDVDDYKKLRRVMRYLRGTKDMPLTLEADDLHVLKSRRTRSTRT